MYRQVNPRASISIERNTSRVPPDSKYYIIKDGEVIASFRSLKKAQSCYQQLVDEMNLPSLVSKETKMSSGQIMDEYYARISNKVLLGDSFSSKGKKSGRFHRAK